MTTLSKEARELRNAYQRKYDSHLSEAAREARNQYQQKWRLNHPSKSREYNTNYWERRARALDPVTRCLACGKELEGMREGAKFCSSACRQKHHREAKG